MNDIDFFEVPALVFASLFPYVLLPPFVLMDERYLVRFRPSTGEMEFGFADDDWHIA